MKATGLVFLKWFSILTFSILLSCSKKAVPNDPVPEHETFIITSEKLQEDRVINVWKPSEYNNTNEVFPVLYMLDGGVEEDFSHLANTLSQLIASGKIKPFILVGIQNTQRRRDLTSPTQVAKDKEIAPVVGGSEAFRNFIKEELFSEIPKRYRVSNQKGIIGESLAGLFIAETLLQHPDMFDYYIAFDPSLWWNDKYLLKNSDTYLNNFPTSSKRFWFAGSSAEDISGNAKMLAEKLNTINIPSLHWHYSDEPNEQHQTIFRATKEKALIWTLNN